MHACTLSAVPESAEVESMQYVSRLPRHPVPALNLPMVAGGRFVLGAARGGKFDLLLF